MTISTGAVIRLSLEGTLPLGQQFVNVLHFRLIGDPLSTDTDTLADLCDAVDTNIVPDYLSFLSSACTLDRIVARTITNPPVGFEKAKNVAGDAGGTPHPHQIALLIVWKTGFLGREFTGRTFLPPTQQSGLANSSWTSGILTAAADIAVDLLALAASTTNTWEFIVWSKTHNHISTVTGYRIIRDARTMTRRTPGFGS